MTRIETADSVIIILVSWLIILLVLKELTVPSRSAAMQRLGKLLLVVIVPLLFSFILIFIFKIAELL